MKDKLKINLKLFTSQTTLLIVGIFFFSTLGATYAYFAFSTSNTTTIEGEAATVNLTLEVNKIFPIGEDLGAMVPQKSTSASNTSPLSSALKRGCIDDNNNTICQVYEIKIKNDGGTATEVVDGKVSFYSDANLTNNSYTKMPNLKWKLITSIDKTTYSNSVLGTNADNTASSTPAPFISNLTLTTNQNYTYYMIIWFNETNQDQIDEGNTYYGKIEFLSSNGTGVTSTFT